MAFGPQGLQDSSTSNRAVVYTLAREHSSECARPARGPYHSGTGIDRSTLSWVEIKPTSKGRNDPASGSRIRPHEKRGIFLSNKPDINELVQEGIRVASTQNTNAHQGFRFRTLSRLSSCRMRPSFSRWARIRVFFCLLYRRDPS